MRTLGGPGPNRGRQMSRSRVSGGAGSQVAQRHLHQVVSTNPVVMIAQMWPCWLPTISALNTPFAAVFVSLVFCELFVSFGVEIPWRGLDDWTELCSWPVEWDSHTILATDSPTFAGLILTKKRFIT